MIYLDYAATSPLRAEVLDAMLPYLKNNFGNADSLHAYGREAAHAVMRARDRIAETVGVSPSEVYFTAGGTEANNWAIRCLGKGTALVSAIEHASVLSALPLRAEKGKICAVNADGLVSVTEFEGGMSEDVGLAAVMAVNNETGSVQKIRELSAVAHRHGALFFSDCVQAECTLDLKELAGCVDALSLSAHKAGGPKGVGALIVKRGASLRPLLLGGEQERGLRGGTLNVAGIVGFAEAIMLSQVERESYAAHTSSLRDAFEKAVLSRVHAKIDGNNRAPNISHLTFETGGEALVNRLDLKGVACSGGAACSAHAALPSHVLVAMGRTEEEARRGVRFSFGRETTMEEALLAAEAVCSLF